MKENGQKLTIESSSEYVNLLEKFEIVVHWENLLAEKYVWGKTSIGGSFDWILCVSHSSVRKILWHFANTNQFERKRCKIYQIDTDFVELLPLANSINIDMFDMYMCANTLEAHARKEIIFFILLCSKVYACVCVCVYICNASQ